MATTFIITDVTPAVTTSWTTLSADLISQATAGTASEAELIAIGSELMKAYKATMRCIQVARAYADANP